MNFTTIALAIMSTFVFSAGMYEMHKERALNKSLVSLIPSQTAEKAPRTILNRKFNLSSNVEKQQRTALNKSVVKMIQDVKEKKALNQALYRMIPAVEKDA